MGKLLDPIGDRTDVSRLVRYLQYTLADFWAPRHKLCNQALKLLSGKRSKVHSKIDLVAFLPLVNRALLCCGLAIVHFTEQPFYLCFLVYYC